MLKLLFRLISMTKTMTNLNQRLITEVLPATFITAVALAFFSLAFYPETKVASAQTMCTADARQCPDGSWVGRTGPNCEFVCPGPGGGNDGTYTNWPGTEYPGTPYEVIPVPAIDVEVDAGVNAGVAYPGGYPGSAGGSDSGVDYDEPGSAAVYYEGGVTSGEAVPLDTNWGAADNNSGAYNDGTYTNWPGTEHPGDGEGSGQTPPDSGTVSFGGSVFYSIGNFFSGVFDWFGW